ncbi:MAG: TIGR03936 family radical SAM-associated protein [Clostridia bacterium]|nr:TIGR03936 family radical SAM-associated protein [Clostridia bacterium]
MEKLRVIYSKSKEAIYLSHLDCLKVFQEALVRADISVGFSKGFNPRPEMTFAHPLSVGIESTGEIFDIILTEEIDIPYFIKELNRVLPSGLTLLAAEYVNLNEKALMSRVYAATYLITFIYPKDKLQGKNLKEIEKLKKNYQNKMDDYLSQRNILVLKKSKDRMERIDIKTQIINYEFTLDGKLEITVSTGSRTNLKPEFVLSGYKEYIDEELEFEIKRTRILYM